LRYGGQQTVNNNALHKGCHQAVIADKWRIAMPASIFVLARSQMRLVVYRLSCR
jgi:hypothetical protein